MALLARDIGVIVGGLRHHQYVQNDRPQVTAVAAQVPIADHHERVAQLVNTQDPSKVEESIMCGGQLTPFPRRYLVDFDTALSAALHYLRAGEADPALTWEWYS